VNKTLGIILIALGLFGLAWGRFTYTTREKVVDIGPIHATRDQTHNVALPPLRARWRSLAALCSSWQAERRNFAQPARELEILKKGRFDNATTYHRFGVSVWPRWRILRP
jgi:hypothetical protein